MSTDPLERSNVPTLLRCSHPLRCSESVRTSDNVHGLRRECLALPSVRIGMVRTLSTLDFSSSTSRDTYSYMGLLARSFVYTNPSTVLCEVLTALQSSFESTWQLKVQRIRHRNPSQGTCKHEHGALILLVHSVHPAACIDEADSKRQRNANSPGLSSVRSCSSINFISMVRRCCLPSDHAMQPMRYQGIRRSQRKLVLVTVDVVATPHLREIANVSNAASFSTELMKWRMYSTTYEYIL